MTPDKYTNAETYLDVGDGHTLYIQDWGAPDARLPILFLHGGPGDGVNDRHKLRFDPRQQRVIFFDQRGSGRSTPLNSTDHNTIDDLVGDITKVRDKLSLDRILITGGSWGSCLALTYALRHNKDIAGMVLQGIFTGTQSEIDWVEQGKFQPFFPELWQTYQGDSASDDPTRQAYAQAQLEYSLLRLDDRPVMIDYETFDPASVQVARHYLDNTCFLPDNYIFDNAAQLSMPIWLVQGRYDMICPPITAWNLHNLLPNSQLLWTTAGHANDRPNHDVMQSLLLSLSGTL